MTARPIALGPLRRRQTLALLALGASALTTRAERPQDLRRPWPAGKPTPPLVLPTWDGDQWRLADARGQVVVLNFWASWCEPCRNELPSLELLAQRHEADKVLVMAVNVRETDAAIRRFLDLLPMSLPILRDSDGAAALAYQARFYPTTVVIGRNGHAAFSVTGEIDWTGTVARQWIAAVL